MSYSVDAVKGTPVTTAAGCGACTGSSCRSTQLAAQRWTGTTTFSNSTELTSCANKSPHGMCYSQYGRDHNLHDIAGYCAPEVNQSGSNESWQTQCCYSTWAIYFWWVVVDIAGLRLKMSASGVMQLDFSAICKVLLCCIGVCDACLTPNTVFLPSHIILGGLTGAASHTTASSVYTPGCRYCIG